MGLYTGGLIFGGGGGAYIRNGVNVSEFDGLIDGGGAYIRGAYIWKFTVYVLWILPLQVFTCKYINITLLHNMVR